MSFNPQDLRGPGRLAGAHSNPSATQPVHSHPGNHSQLSNRDLQATPSIKAEAARAHNASAFTSQHAATQAVAPVRAVGSARSPGPAAAYSQGAAASTQGAAASNQGAAARNPGPAAAHSQGAVATSQGGNQWMRPSVSSATARLLARRVPSSLVDLAEDSAPGAARGAGAASGYQAISASDAENAHGSRARFLPASLGPVVGSGGVAGSGGSGGAEGASAGLNKRRRSGGDAAAHKRKALEKEKTAASACEAIEID